MARRYPNDWCGQAAGLIKSPGYPNRPDLAQVTGPAQLVAHMFSRALAADTMHAVNISQGPALQFTIMGSQQPCLQAAAFAGGNGTTIAILNICATHSRTSCILCTWLTTPDCAQATRQSP